MRGRVLYQAEGAVLFAVLSRNRNLEPPDGPSASEVALVGCVSGSRGASRMSGPNNYHKTAGLTIKQLRALLRLRKWTAKELAAAVHLRKNTVQHYLPKTGAKSEYFKNDEHWRGQPMKRYWLDPDGPEAA